MPLMPADVSAVAFSKPPLGKRGYDEDEVEAFLDLVGAELARLIQETLISATGLSRPISSSLRRSTPEVTFAG